MKIEDEQVREILNDYNKLDFKWDRFAANFEPTEINADAYVKISETKTVHLQIYVNL